LQYQEDEQSPHARLTQLHTALPAYRQKLCALANLAIWDDQSARDRLLTELSDLFYALPFDQLTNLLCIGRDDMLQAQLHWQLDAIELAIAASQACYEGLFVERASRLVDALLVHFIDHGRVYECGTCVNAPLEVKRLEADERRLLTCLLDTAIAQRPLTFRRSIKQAAAQAEIPEKQAIILEHQLLQKLHSATNSQWRMQQVPVPRLLWRCINVLADFACYRQSEAAANCCEALFQTVIENRNESGEILQSHVAAALLAFIQMQLRREQSVPLKMLVTQLVENGWLRRDEWLMASDEARLLRWAAEQAQSLYPAQPVFEVLDKSAPVRAQQWQEKFAHYQPQRFFILDNTAATPR